MSISYRKEIDGLRAIAVFSVIANHISLIGFGGGFIGVDIFFVISGFLIFQIIYKEKIDNQFSFVRFYERRARRILPALYVMTAITSIVSFLVLLPKDLKYYGKSLAAVALMCSNLVFPGQSGYFDPDSDLRPLLHTWSLAVEEQFYLIFPALVVLLWKRTIIFQVWIYSILAVASLAYAHHRAYISPDINFFMLSSRLWELLVGVIGAIFFLYKTEWILQHKKTGNIVSVCGMFFIFYAICFFNQNLPYPSAFTLLPTCGALMVLIFANDKNFIGKFLANKILVGLGVSSYSIYLWHQPIFSLTKYLSPSEFSFSIQLSLIACVLIVGHFSFVFIEQTTRRRFDISGIGLLKYVICGLVIFISTGFTFYISNGFLSSYADTEAASHYQVLNAKEYIPNQFNVLRNKSFDLEDPNPKVLIIGDSYAQDVTNAIFEVGIHNKVQLSTYYISSRCGNLYIKIGYRLLQDAFNLAQCPSESPYFTDENLMRLLNEADVILLVSSWKINQVQKITESLENIKQKYSAKVIVFGTKNFGEMRLGNWMQKDSANRSIIRGDASLQSKEVNFFLKNSLSSHIFVDVSSVFCPTPNSCILFDSNGNLLTNDGHHLTIFGARKLGAKLLEEYSDIFLP